MTPPLDVIRQLLVGRPEAAAELAPACRTQAYGAEAFGGVMACQMFERQPAPLSREPHVVVAAHGLAIFDTDAEGVLQAIFADLYDGRIGRLWRLGGGATDSAAEPALLIAADAMLGQLRDSVALTPGDHPGLDIAAIPALRQLAASVAILDPEGEGAVVDGRAMVIRAFTEGDRGAALLALAHRGPPHQQVHAAVSFRFGAQGLTHRHVVFGRAPRAQPRLTLLPSQTDAAQGTSCDADR